MPYYSTLDDDDDREELTFLHEPEEQDDSDGEDGEGGDKGTTGPLIDPAIFGLANHDFLELIRQEERKFSQGWVPFTKDPAKEKSGTLGQGPPPHPLLSQSSQFSGADTKLTANPAENEQGLANYEELQLQHVLKNDLTNTKQHVNQPGLTTPRLTPSGGR